MISRFVVPKAPVQLLLNLHRRLFHPATVTTCANNKKVLFRTFTSTNKPVYTEIMKRDTMIRDSSIGEQRHNSADNTGSNTINGKGSTEFTTTTTSSNGNGEKEQLPKDDKPSGNASTGTTCNDEDKYSVQIENGFMKVSMMPVSTSTPGMMERPTNNNDTNFSSDKEDKASSSNEQENDRNTQTKIPETVLHFQRQMRKTQAAKRASTPLLKSQLQIIYNDAHIVVVNKPSGVLTVPGINSNPSMLTLLHEEYKHELDPAMKREHMIVHRLDMDTSGIVIYAKTKKALLSLQGFFREREGVSKYYEAVVCGHIRPEIEKGSIDLPLQRDHRFPPFMRVATPKSEREAQEVVKDLKNAGWKKIVKKKPKPSQTLFEVIGRDYRYSDVDADVDVDGKGCQEKVKHSERERYPVTRVRLTPITGRTHQLRVHCASIGHPILGDPTYGIYGEASSNGGFEDDLIDALIPDRAPIDLQLSLDQYAKDIGQVMCLHARELHVKHPETGEQLVFEQPPTF